MKIYFSDFFDISPALLDDYGALNISLINDLPLFIDPFLLFNSKSPAYQKLHAQMLEYLGFLRDYSVKWNGNVSRGLLSSWYTFPEIKQTWLGFSKHGNSGNGPGMSFAKSLNASLCGIFQDFDKEKISAPHIEKLCLIKEGVGRDNISDFVSNLIHQFLLNYTQDFCQKHLSSRFLQSFAVRHVSFDYTTCTWQTKSFVLPHLNQDYVLLTPKDILTKDNTWINKHDLVANYADVARSIGNEQLRAELNNYFLRALPVKLSKKGERKENSFQEKTAAVAATIQRFPILLDYYLRYKEDRGDEAVSVANDKVHEIENIFISQLPELVRTLENHTQFYSITENTSEAVYQRILFLKDCIENKGCHTIFYNKNKPVAKEIELQILFRLTWFSSQYDVNREVNNGRGPVDFKISKGSSDISLVEFKLASNSQLAKNLSNQVKIYKKANQTNDKQIIGYTVIVYFTEQEYDRVWKILKQINRQNDPTIILIDARLDNKISASKAKEP